MPLLGHVGVLLASPLTGTQRVGLELTLTVFINMKTSNAWALTPKESIGLIWAVLFPSPEVNPSGNVPALESDPKRLAMFPRLSPSLSLSPKPSCRWGSWHLEAMPRLGAEDTGQWLSWTPSFALQRKCLLNLPLGAQGPRRPWVKGAAGSPHCLHGFRGSQDFWPRLGNGAGLDKGGRLQGGPARSLVAAQNLQPAELRPVLGGVPAVEP